MNTKTFQDECNAEANNRKIAADLHDDLGSVLTSLKLSLRELLLKQPGNGLIENSTHLLEQSILTVKTVSFNLVPREIETGGLHAAVEALVERMNATALMDVYYKAVFDGTRFDKQKAMFVYRVIQEMVTNAVKHAGGSMIEIGIAQQINRLLVEVRDDGQGFDFESAVKKKNSSGLKNIRSRLDVLHAVLMVESNATTGTHYFINIPIKELTNE
ncbi:hypothetical protein GWC95_15455 [Sediminibacterium roseum]|uniref:histidine kinase n=1 Tax=Sediminibacterium roseum TaxID=1978412 RepID=A0ABW9ZWD8_9BACT|nr:ATP-binding protein [Sediminibacterium roseum]NCI51324.1 hypothetical protein [Sediminibacterium roseum]